MKRAPLAAALWTLVLAPPVAAHEFVFTDVLVVFKTDGGYVIEMRVDVDALALGVSPSTDSAEVAAALEQLGVAQFEIAVERARDTILRRVRVRFDGRKQRPVVSFPGLESPESEPDPELPTVLGTVARLAGRVPPDAVEFTFGASRAFQAVHLTILDQETLGGVRDTLQQGADSRVYRLDGSGAPPDRVEVAVRYTILGFEHILPKGLDHILFVLGLFLLGTRLKPLLWQVTAFTVAHSTTLALAMKGIVELPERLVETLIALSIAYVALENVFTSELKPWRPPLVFGFGLLHGMGFARVLIELGLPGGEFVTALAGFNIGVELGQLCVIGLALAAVGWARHRPWYRRRLVVPSSAVIALIGLYWAVERAL